MPGGTLFFTLATNARQPLLVDNLAQQLFGECFREAKVRWPFEMNAVVLLRDHLHAIWTLPRDDADYSLRWAWIKKEFAKRWLEREGVDGAVSEGRLREVRRGVWQPRFWEHTIADETDFERHFDYIHYNPVKNQFVQCPRDWPVSSFHCWVKAGIYPENWACSNASGRAMLFSDIKTSVGESNRNREGVRHSLTWSEAKALPERSRANHFIYRHLRLRR